MLYVAALIGGTAHANAPVPEGPLVSTEWLAANLNRADVRIVEVSVNPGLYERSHVPGAVNFSWHNDSTTRCAATSWARSSSRNCCRRPA